jgi:hypothetical protein
MAYIEGAYEVQPGDPVRVRRNGKPLEREAIWDRGRKHLEERARVREAVPA